MSWGRSLFCVALATVVITLAGGGVKAGTGTITAGSPARLDVSALFSYNESNPDDWKPLFEEASKLLYDSTEKQLQLGTVTLFETSVW